MSAVMIRQECFENPLDTAEMVMLDRDQPFERSSDGDLLAEATGVWGSYKLWLSWQEEYAGLSITCMIDTKVTKATLLRVHTLLAIANERMWMGHFGIDSDAKQIMFRHTLLAADEHHIAQNDIQQMLDTAVQECERFYPALQSVVWGGKDPKEALEYALFETVGEA